jgi:glucokinase
MTQISIVGDFGGTNARLALSTPAGIAEVLEYKCADFPSPAAIVKAYLTRQGVEKAERAVIAIAGVSEDPSRVMFTNGPWAQTPLDFTMIPAEKTETINDFAAVCYSVGILGENDCTSLINDHAATFFPGSILTANTFKADPSRILTSKPEHRFVAIGAGTGLGVGSGMVTESKQFLVMGGEGGHLAFAPQNEQELEIKEYLEDQCGMIVTQETFGSGTGLVKAFNAICLMQSIDCVIENGSEVIKKLDDSRLEVRKAAEKTLELFAFTLGTCAASAALVTNARTVFIGGGVVAKMGSHFNKEAFSKAFTTNDLGKNNALPNVPVMLIDHPQAGLAGADFYLRLTAT